MALAILAEVHFGLLHQRLPHERVVASVSVSVSVEEAREVELGVAGEHFFVVFVVGVRVIMLIPVLTASQHDTDITIVRHLHRIVEDGAG